MHHKTWHLYLMTTIGCAIMGIAYNVFYIPFHMLSGGVGGIAMLIFYLTGTSMFLTSMLLNLPLFLLAYRYMDKAYLYNALYGTFIFSLCLDAFHPLGAKAGLDNIIIACLAGGVLNGIGASCLYRVGGSSGGMDIVGSIINKYFSISIGTVIFLLNSVLMIAMAFIYGLAPALYSLLAFFVTFRTTNAFTTGFDYKKTFIIISDKHTEIAQEIIDYVGRGVTYFYAEGAYTHQERKVIFVVARLTQVAKIRGIIQRLDPHAFVILQDANDVFGKGFNPHIGMNPLEEEEDDPLAKAQNVPPEQQDSASAK